LAAKERNSAQRAANWFGDSHLLKTGCATPRKTAQKVVLELEIRCSIQLSYGRQMLGELRRFSTSPAEIFVRRVI
jgi:hypothetical protein